MCAARMTSFSFRRNVLSRREEALARELLRDRAAAFGAPALLEVPQDGAAMRMTSTPPCS